MLNHNDYSSEIVWPRAVSSGRWLLDMQVLLLFLLCSTSNSALPLLQSRVSDCHHTRFEAIWVFPHSSFLHFYEQFWERLTKSLSTYSCWPGNHQHLEGWMDSALTGGHLQPLRFSPSWPQLCFQPHLLRSPLKAPTLTNLVSSHCGSISVLWFTLSLFPFPLTSVKDFSSKLNSNT